MLISAQVDIALIAIALAIVSQMMQRKLVDKKGMKRKQEEMKKKQEMVKELMKRTDEKSKSELQALEQEMMESMSTMMKGSMKLMVFSMILFIPTLWFLSASYEGIAVDLPIPIPWFGGDRFIMLYNRTNWIGWYVLCSLCFNLGLNAIINLYEKVRGGENA